MTRVMGLVRRGLANSILRHNLVFFLSSGAMGITNYLLSTTLARRLPPGDYSQVGVALNVLGPIQPLAAAIGVAIVRTATENRVRNAPDETDPVQRTLFRAILVIHLVLFVLMLVFHTWVVQFFRLTHPALPYLAVVISAVSFFFGLFQSLLQERGQYGRLSALYFGESVFRLGAGLLAVALGYGVTGVIVVYLAAAVLIVVPLPRPPALLRGAQASWRLLQPIVRDIGTLTLSNIGIALLISVDVALCRTFLDPVTADRYVALAAIAKFFLSITGWAGPIAFRHLVEGQQRGDHGVRPLVTSFGMIVGLGIPFVAFCAAFGPFVIGFAFGAPFRASGAVLWITAVSAVAVSLLQLEIAYFNAVQWPWYLPVFVIGSVATVAALPLAHHALRGYATIYAIGTTALVLVLFVLMLARLRQKAPSDGISGDALPARMEAPEGIGVSEAQ